MRILVDGIPRELGGIGTLIMNLVSYNEKAGNRDAIIFEFLVPQGSEYISVLRNGGYCFFEIPKVCTPEYKKKIKTIFKNNRYDFVWINNTSKVNITLPRIAKKNDTKIITHSHGVSTEAKGIKKIIFSVIEKLNEKKYCELIDIPFACSKASAEFFYPPRLQKKCKVVSNGIEANKYMFNEDERRKIRDELDIKNTDVLIGAVGRLTAVKNYEFIVELFPQLPNNYKMIILGEGEKENHLKSIIDNKGIGDRFFLLGKKHNISSFLSAMDVLVMPSLNEGLPFALVEAQANGLKCVVSTGVSEEAKIIDSVYFISLNDKKAWRDELLAQIPDVNLRKKSCSRIGTAGFDIEASYLTFVESVK